MVLASGPTITLANATGLPIATGVTGLASGVIAFLATPSSANLSAMVVDESGTGPLLFANAPAVTTPTIATSANYLAGAYEQFNRPDATHQFRIGYTANDLVLRYSFDAGLIASINSVGDINTQSTTASTTTATGSITTGGGIGVAGAINAGGAITTAGAVNATGAVASGSSILSSGTQGVGYTTGAGGAVVQATSKTTTVPITKPTGTITLVGSSIGAGAISSFAITGSVIGATDQVVVTHESVGTLGAYSYNGRVTGAGAGAIDARNNTGGALSEAIVLRYSIIKSVNA
jgi:hypothetical protein